MARNKIRGVTAIEKEFLNVFHCLCTVRGAWEVWADFVEVTAISITNAVDKSQFEDREARYMELIRRYTHDQQLLFGKLLELVADALEENPDQDFLGALYMRLELGNHWKGQFFTPFHICHAMASMTAGNIAEQIETKGWMSVADPCCGAGAMFIAFATECRQQKVNYQQHVLFVGQDVDPVVAYMCYIQISLLGCAGYVKIGNSLTEPMPGDPLLPQPDPRLWITPVFCTDVWHWRRVYRQMDQLFRTDDKEATTEEKEPMTQGRDEIQPPQQLRMF